MTVRASIRTGDLNRYLKAAKAHGYMVEIDGETVRLLPSRPEEALSPEPGTTSAQEALKRWRRSA